MPNEIIEALLELGLTPMDWFDASQLSNSLVLLNKN